MGEFDLIHQYFSARTRPHSGTLLGVGDDCAVIDPGGEQLQAVTTDTLVSGVHFLPDVNPRDLGFKSLAVNLSDLASMGAVPAWFTLALTLSTPDPAWLQEFSDGLHGLAEQHGLDLIGGDTTRGPLSVTITAIGRIDSDRFLRRSGANHGDLVFMTGHLGSAGLGLKQLLGQWATDDSEPLERLLRPAPRVAEGRRLLGLASACIDVSDGLAADLGHILEHSGVGAEIQWEQLPLSHAVREYIGGTEDWAMPLVAGDDYELCFTAPGHHQTQIEDAMAAQGCRCTVIGRILRQGGLRIVRGGRTVDLPKAGYDHFAAA